MNASIKTKIRSRQEDEGRGNLPQALSEGTNAPLWDLPPTGPKLKCTPTTTCTLINGKKLLQTYVGEDFECWKRIC
jgi:hypothetical protein